MVKFSDIPEELQSRPQWVLWRWETRHDKTTDELKWTKPPYQPNGISAESDNPNTWVSFEEVKAVYERGGFSGVGYVVTVDTETTDRHPGMVDDGITGVDLDHVVDPETGRIEPWAQSIVDKLGSYTEISPSDTGLRIFVLAKLPPKDRKLGCFECYESGRYLTVTGNHLPGTPATIEHRQNEMTAVHTEIFAERNEKHSKQGPPPKVAPVDLDDDALLEVAFRAKNGEAVRQLYYGDTGQYATHSEADLALCSHLAFYASGEASRVDRMFRASELYRPKWDEQRGSQTYGEMTIAKALQGQTEYYSPGKNGTHSEAHTRGFSQGLPAIQISGRHMREITSDAVEALKSANSKNPVLFSRGTSLVRLRTGNAGTSAEALGQASLRGVLDRSADFVKFTKDGDTPARPPNDVVADILTLPDPVFPGLRGFSEAPVFLPGGNLLSQPGYDGASGLFMTLIDLEGIRSDIAIQDAVSLLQDDLLRDFPFADVGSRVHALALLIQPYVRYLIDGPTPLILIDAPARGTGKGLLVDVASGISLGRPAYVMTLPKDEDELDKRITATLVEGSPMILLDNVTTLKSNTLSAVLTTTLWKGRWLGKSQMVEAPNSATWISTGNNVVLSDEMVRRVVHIRLDAGEERPEERTGFNHPDLMAWVRHNRPLLVSACLSIVQAWVDAGMPKGQGTLGRFEAWVNVMGGIMEVAEVPGFLSNRDRLHVTTDPESQEWAGLCAAWYSVHGNHPITARDVLPISKRQNLLLDLWVGRNDLSAQQRLGNALKARRDRVFGVYQIRLASQDSRTGNFAYYISKLESSGKRNTRNTRNTGNQIKHVPEGEAQDTGKTPQNTLTVPDAITGVSGVSGVSERPAAPDDVLEVD
jgi:hypothetical protein